jgi:hypothetical protein
MGKPKTTQPPWTWGDSDDTIDLAAIRENLDSLAVAIESGSPSVPATPDHWRRCLREIARGVDWNNRTWL